MKTQKLFICIITALVFFGCKRNESPQPGNNPGTPTTNTYTPPPVTFSATVQGFVMDEAGNAIANADIKTGSKTAKTDVNGYFKIDNAPFTGDFCYIKATKNGFFTASTTIHGKADSSFATELMLMAQDNITSFPATQAKTITVGNASVLFPANSTATLDGKAYTGTVSVAVEYLDPSAANFSKTIPGGDLRGYDTKSQNVQLLSYGMLNVELRDGAGNLLQMAAGKKATLTMPVPAAMLATAPAAIPLWYFDESKGIWIEEGSATKQGTTYTGTVSHFTPWNIDKPFPPAVVKGKVVDSKGNPISQAPVKMGQTIIYSNADGSFIFYTSSDMDQIVDIIDNETGQPLGINKAIHTPQLGKTIDLGTITMPQANKILFKANVVDCSNNPFTGYAVIKKGNYTGRTYVTNGSFRYLLLATGGEAELSIYSLDISTYNTSKITVPTNASASEKDLDTIKVCDTSNVSYVKFTYTLPGQQPVTIIKIATKTSEGYQYNSLGNTYTAIDFIDKWDNNNSTNNTFGIWFRFNATSTGTKVLTHGKSGFKGDGWMSYVDQLSYLQVAADSVILNISKYGNVGDIITGTFSGKARIVSPPDHEYDMQPLGVITNGEFRVKRIADK